MHMPNASKLETSGSVPCGGEHVLLRCFCSQLMYKTIGPLHHYFPSVPLGRILALQISDVNLTLRARGLVEVYIQISGD